MLTRGSARCICNDSPPDLIFELFEIEIIELLREQSSTPRPSIDPHDDPFDESNNCVLGINACQFPAHSWVAASPAADGYEIVPVLGL